MTYQMIWHGIGAKRASLCRIKVLTGRVRLKREIYIGAKNADGVIRLTLK